MLANHLAAIVLFSGPAFWVALWMVLDPAGFVALLAWSVRVFGTAVQRIRMGGTRSEEMAQARQAGFPRSLQKAVRVTGVALLLIAIAL